MSLLRRVFAAAALVAFGLTVGLAMTEGALRIYDALKPQPPIPRGDFWDPIGGYGWLHPPGVEGPWFDDHGEFSLVVRMNSHGLRDVEHEYAKPPGVFRILLLGDSYMEAVQVPLEQIFPRLLEQAINVGGRRVEVINASVADWGTDNELVYLREEGFKYSPDLVLLAFTTANDVRNNSAVLNANPIPKPTFTMTPQGALEFHPMPPLPPSPPPPPWWQHVRVAVFFVNRAGHWFGMGASSSLTPAPAPTASPAAPAVAVPPPAATVAVANVPTDMLVYASPPSREVADAWVVTRALILELQREARKHGAKFAMFFVNGPWAHYDESWGMMTMNDEVARNSWSRRTPNDTLAPFVTEKNIPFVDLFPEFETKKTAQPLYFRYDPHWTPAGHRVAADTVARFLVDSGIVAQP